MENKNTLPEWALVEVMGHKQYAGRLTEVAVAGSTLIRVEVPRQVEINVESYDKSMRMQRDRLCEMPAFTILLSGAAVFRITPIAEDEARNFRFATDPAIGAREMIRIHIEHLTIEILDEPALTEVRTAAPPVAKPSPVQTAAVAQPTKAAAPTSSARAAAAPPTQPDQQPGRLNREAVLKAPRTPDELVDYVRSKLGNLSSSAIHAASYYQRSNGWIEKVGGAWKPTAKLLAEGAQK